MCKEKKEKINKKENRKKKEGKKEKEFVSIFTIRRLKISNNYFFTNCVSIILHKNWFVVISEVND
jgi:hypothetical protein